MKNKTTAMKTALIFLAVFILLAILGSFIIFKTSFEAKAYPGSAIGNLDLSKKTKQETIELISKRIEEIEKQGISFKHGDSLITIKSGSDVIDSGYNYLFLSFSADESADLFFDKSGNKNYFLFLKHFLTPNKNDGALAVFTLEEEPLKKLLKEKFSNLIIEPENAFFSFSDNGQGGELINNPEKIGKDISYDKALSELKLILAQLENKTILLQTESIYPTIKKEALETSRQDAEEMMRKGGTITLVFQSNSEELKWKVRPKNIVSWISVTDSTTGKPGLSLDYKKISTYLEEVVAPDIDEEISLPKFEMNGGRVSSWQNGKDGRKLNLEASSIAITDAFLSGTSSVSLVVDSVPVDSSSVSNDLKITEIIGTGHSNFKGSSPSRIHNIKTGASALHGLLIKPGEEFSLISNLGSIDASGGYKTELVIKGDKTTPEYGGGLCQVGTTVFRTALQSGLPITMRRNHSYRVSYYEPAGTDATIYDPWPDFRFINDTGNYILIQYRMSGNDLYFDFWGTKDGRQVTVTEPTIYNIVKPEPTKIIETDELEPGKKKCTESSHNGADAYFDYKVVYPEGSTTTPTVETRFRSHYVPWQAVCLVGKEKTASSTPTTSTTTAPLISSSTPQ